MIINYRHLKRICRGESEYSWTYFTHLEESKIEQELLKCACNILYVRDSYCDVHCIPQQPEPIIWFRYLDRGDDLPRDFDLFIGVKLYDAVRLILHTRKYELYAWYTEYTKVLNFFIEHMAWQLRKEGIKYGRHILKPINENGNIQEFYRKVTKSFNYFIEKNYGNNSKKWNAS